MADYGLTEEWLRKELSVAKKTENEKRNQMKEFTNLKTEKKLQEYLTTNCEEMKLIDTYNTPLCSFNRATKDGEAVLFANAKPDAVSQMRGGASWELKGSSLVADLLRQMLQRVVSSLMMNHTLTDSICFGVSGGECYVVVGLQSYPLWDRVVKLHLFSINPNTILSLWAELSVGPTPMFNMNKFGLILWKFIQDLIGDEAAPHFVRIRFLGCSAHCVFQLNFPKFTRKDTGNPGGHKILTIFKDRPKGIAVKIFFDKDFCPSPPALPSSFSRCSSPAFSSFSGLYPRFWTERMLAQSHLYLPALHPVA